MVPMARILGKSMVIINKFSNGFLCKITKKIPKLHLCAPPYALYATAGRWRPPWPVFRPQTPYAKFFFASAGALARDYFPGITTRACQNLPHMHKSYGRSYSVVNPEEQRLSFRADVHMIDFY